MTGSGKTPSPSERAPRRRVRDRVTTTPRIPAWRRPALLASALFLAALAFRLLLRALSGDGHLPHGPAFQGDAVRYLLEAVHLSGCGRRWRADGRQAGFLDDSAGNDDW